MNKKDTVLKEIEDFYEEGIKARRTFESDWYLNMSFVLGRQFVNWSQVKNALIDTPRPAHRLRIIANRLFPVLRILLAKITRAKPLLYVVGENRESKSRDAARVGWKVLNSLWDSMEIPSDIYELAIWLSVCGTGFMAPYFDNNDGEVMMIEETQEDGSIKEVEVRTGTIKNEVLSPFEIIPEPGVHKHNTIRKIMRLAILPIKEVMERYNVKDIESEDLQMTPMELSLQQAIAKSPIELKDSVRVKELREKPSREHPEGRLVTIAGSKILYQGPLPKEYDSPGLGISKFDFMKFGKRYWGISLFTQLRPLQRRYNLGRSELAEYIRDFCKGKWMIPNTARLDPNALTDEAGEKVLYNYAGPNSQPTAVRGPELPMTFFRNLEEIKAEMDDFSGIHDVSQAKAPKWVKSGVALDMLQEQDSSQLAPTMGLFELALGHFGKSLLRIAQLNFKEPRSLRTFSKEYPDVVLKKFLGADLKGNMEVRVSLGSALPQSRGARVNYVLSLWREKLIQDPKAVLKLIELQEMEFLYKEEMLDEANANSENDDMSEGIAREVAFYDAHILHIKSHTLWLKNPDHRRVNKQLLKLFHAHIALHLQKMNTQLSPNAETVPANLSGSSMGAREKVSLEE